MAAKKSAKKAKKAAGGKPVAAAKKVAATKKASLSQKSAKRRAAPKRAAPKRPDGGSAPKPPVTSIVDHLTLPVHDYARSKAFYTAALAPLGVELVMEWATFAGFGVAKKPSFWIGEAKVTEGSYWRPEHRAGAAPVHVAFVAGDRAAVDAFHAAALAAGGVDHGAPGLRPEYHPGYYGAFVLDPDGHNVEAVHHTFG